MCPPYELCCWLICPPCDLWCGYLICQPCVLCCEYIFMSTMWHLLWIWYMSAMWPMVGYTSIPQCEPFVTPLLTHWRYCSLAMWLMLRVYIMSRYICKAIVSVQPISYSCLFETIPEVPQSCYLMVLRSSRGHKTAPIHCHLAGVTSRAQHNTHTLPSNSVTRKPFECICRSVGLDRIG